MTVKDKIQIVFARTSTSIFSESAIENLVELEVKCASNFEEITSERVFDAIAKAVTNWATSTEEGKVAIEESCEDFNIGDFLSYYEDEELKEALKEEGIIDIKVVYELSSKETIIGYDKRMYRPQE